MRKTKKLAALMLAGAMAASLAACGGQTASTDTTAAESADGEESKEAEQTADGETYKIGVLQLTQHVALDKPNEVWTWDITYFRTSRYTGVFYYAYVIVECPISCRSIS